MHQLLPDLTESDDRRIATIRLLIAEDAYVINLEQLVGKVIDFEIALSEAQNDPS